MTIDFEVQNALGALDMATQFTSEDQRTQAMRRMLIALGDPAFVVDEMIRDRLIYVIVRRLILSGEPR